MNEETDYEELICPHCLGFIVYNKSEDEIICPNCNRTITEEDLENVFTEDTTITGEKIIST